MYKTIVQFLAKMLCLFVVLPASADNYRISSHGNSVEKAVLSFTQKLSDLDTGIDLEHVTNIASSGDLIQNLEKGSVDIVVVPFEFVPGLTQSPLLEPFLAKNAKEIRKAINSEIGAFEKNDVESGGFRVLDFWHVSSTILGSNALVAKVDDLKGLKILEGGGQRSETLLALGAATTQLPPGEIYAAVKTGFAASSEVPFDGRAKKLGFTEVFNNYVDRLYKPRIYAVLILGEKWTKLPFSHQHYLAKSAKDVGEELAEWLDEKATKFKNEELSKGVKFNSWSPEDISKVQLARLNLLDRGAVVERQLVNLVFESTAEKLPPVGRPIKYQPAAEIDLLFVTDRKLVNINRPEVAFSSARKLRGHNFGVAKVSLVNRRQYGANIKNVIDIVNLSSLTEDMFLNYVAEDREQDFTIFIHGYNNSFTDSIRRGSTIQTDIALGSVVICYTWPSDGELLSYGYDESSTDTAEQNFKIFMDRLTGVVPASRINIIAHSMGSRLLTKYLAGLPERGYSPREIKFRNIVLAAPDISTTFFKQKEEEPFDPRFPISAYSNTHTVYSSQYDRPLGLSQKLHRDQRLGLADQSTIYLEKDITSVDASLIDPAKWYQNFSFATRHSYVFDKLAGVQDLSMLLNGFGPERRSGIAKMKRDDLAYWVLSP